MWTADNQNDYTFKPLIKDASERVEEAQQQAAKKAGWILNQCELFTHEYLLRKGFPDERGILVNPGDSPGLAQAMERFSSNPEEARRMGLAGYEKLKRQYTRDLWLQRIGGVYESVLSH